MNALEREIEVLRGLCACRGDDDCVDEASNELTLLRGIEAAAKLACGLLWMVDERGDKEHAAYMALRDALGGSGSEGLKAAIETAIAAGHEADHPPDADWWAGKKELDMRPNTELSRRADDGD